MGSGMGGMILPIASRFGWKGILIGLVLMLILGGGSLFSGIFGGGDDEDRRQTDSQASAPDDAASFVGFVLDDVQNTWEKIFAARGQKYQRADLILFTGQTGTRCGYGSAAVGPFYCPMDSDVYIDLSFYKQLRDRFGAPGDFAQAYVIAHEIGHHVQHQLGVTDRIQSGDGAKGAGGDAVRLELQADCFAGVWARSSSKRDLLDPGDIEEAIGAAQAIGDDTLQRQTQGRVQPENWTHGSSEQRARWFKRGYEQGDPNACDTFAAKQL